jgi:outer membrane lipoprotein carrier protein
MLEAALAAVLLASPIPGAAARAPLAVAQATAPRPAAAPAPAGPAADLARKVQALYERTRDLEARFTQTYVYAGLGRKLVSTGTLKVKKPGLMRWDYATPSRKTIAVAGSRLVQWEPEEKQAYVDEHFDATAMSAAVTFLLGQGDLSREFHLALGEGGALVLTPRAEDPRVQRITLAVGPEGEVLGTTVLDGAGNENRLVFEQMRRNAGLSDADFHVALPGDARRIGPPGR